MVANRNEKHPQRPVGSTLLSIVISGYQKVVPPGLFLNFNVFIYHKVVPPGLVKWLFNHVRLCQERAGNRLASGGDRSPLCFSLFLYAGCCFMNSLGVIPAYFLKLRLKEALELKPQS